MKNFVITIDKNRLVTDSSDAAVFIFENIKGYEDEVFDLLDIHNIKMSELEAMVNSWAIETTEVKDNEKLKDVVGTNFYTEQKPKDNNVTVEQFKNHMWVFGGMRGFRK